MLFQKAGSIDRSMQVSGLEEFPERRWREAFLHYLFGIWGDVSSVTYRPKLSSNYFGWRLTPERRLYDVSGAGCSHLNEMPKVDESRILCVGCEQFEFEGGLIRFVKNNEIRVLVIYDRANPILWMWKTEHRGELRTATMG